MFLSLKFLSKVFSTYRKRFANSKRQFCRQVKQTLAKLPHWNICLYSRRWRFNLSDL